MNKRKVLISSVLVLALVAGFYFYQNSNSSNEDTAPPSSEENDGINFNPPTEEETKAAEDHKKEIGNQSFNNTPQEPTSNKVKPLLTSYGVYDGSVEVAARVPKVFEANGTCTLKLSKDGQTVAKSRQATRNVSEMSCGYIAISTSKLSPGNWSARVSYNSPNYSGTSDAVNIRVP